MPDSVHFSIQYDGPALASHQMDVRELAPALIALSELLEAANQAAYPDAHEVRVNVQGNFKRGSFGVDLIAVQSVAQQVIDMLAGDKATATANLLGILTGLGLIGSGGGLVALIQWLRGRKPSTVRTVGDKVVFELIDNAQKETFEVGLVAGRLYQTRVVRQKLAKVVKPLEQDGVDVFATACDGQTQTVIHKEQRPWFDMAANEADVVSNTLRQRVLLQIESAVFKEDNKWRFHDGTTAFFAELADEDFVQRVKTGGERFGNGDLLVADLRIVQTVTDEGLKQTYFVEHVHEHRAPLQQVAF